MKSDLTRLLAPSAIAVIGASDGEAKIGGRMLASLLRHGFQGAVYPVNPQRDTIHGLKAYPNVASLPGQVDLAIVCIPAQLVAGIVEECGQASIPYVMVTSSGFAEEGAEGAALQDELIATARAAGVTLLGPNAEGFFNVSEGIAATFSPAINLHNVPRALGKKVGIVAQSGGLGFALYNRGRSVGLDFSAVVSVGNQAMLDVSDYCDVLVDDPNTDVLLVFVEGIKKPQEFALVAAKARRLGKPIVVAKVGTSNAGMRAVVSHTGSLGGLDSAYDAYFERYGVIRVSNPESMLETAAMLSRFPPVKGNRVAIISSSGGTAVWLSDLCEASGLRVPELSSETQARIMEFLPSYGSAANPIDVTGQSMRGFSRSLEVLKDNAEIDAILIVGSFAHEGRLKAEGADIAAIAQSSSKPVVLYTYTDASAASKALLDGWGMYFFSRMEGCAQAIATSWKHNQLAKNRYARVRPEGLPQVAGPRKLVTSSIGPTVPEYRAKEVLRLYWPSMSRDRLVKDAGAAGAAAAEIGFPVALKVQSAELPHKTEAGAIKLNVLDAEAASAAFEEITRNASKFAPKAKIDGVLVQPMAKPGVEMIAGVLRDETLGPLVMCGFGGIHVEVLKDVVFSLAPLSEAEAFEILGRLKAAAMFEGVRGAAKLDLASMANLLVRLSWLAHDMQDQVDEIDLNPVLLYPEGQGVAVVDALMVKRAGQAK